MDWVITSYSPAGFDQYGERFIESFDRHWPTDVGLIIYDEGSGDNENLTSKFGRLIISRDLELVPDMIEFTERHRDHEYVKGREYFPGQKPWKPKCVREGYNFRYDAWKFCRKILAIRDAARIQTVSLMNISLSGVDRLIWIDADVVVKRSPPPNFFDIVLPKGVDISYLGRQDGYHSECGFVAYDLNDLGVREFIRLFAEVYSKDLFIAQDEWHDSWLFDWLRGKAGPGLVRFKNLSVGERGHVFDKTFNPWMRHNKGDLKTAEGR